MSPLRADELEEFWQAIAGTTRSPTLDSDAIELQGFLERHDEILTALYGMLVAIVRSGRPEIECVTGTLASVFSTGFSMGREYESRHQAVNELERLLAK